VSATTRSTKPERIYFDTSAFNHLVKSLDYQSFLGTRDLQALRGRELLISPITIWELLLTPNEEVNDFLVFSAQHLFASVMLGAPTELLIRYLETAYPENRANYDTVTSLPIGTLWQRMAADPGVTFIFDPQAIQKRAQYLRRLGTNLSGIVTYPTAPIDREEIRVTAEVLSTFYNAMLADGFFPKEVSGYDHQSFYRLVLLFAWVLFVLELDFDPRPMSTFWEKVGIPPGEMTKRLTYVFDTYPQLLVRGPLLEMAVMAYSQLEHGRRSRGTVFDSFHMSYIPYVSEIISADEDFRTLRDSTPRYRGRIRHVDEINMRATLYVAPE
jgi:hypothetical protein